MGSEVLGSIPTSVSQNGSNWRWSGRETVQNRLLSWNPAEAKIRRFTPWAHPVAGIAARIAATTSSSPATFETNLDFILIPPSFIWCIALQVPELGIQVVPHPVAQQVERQHG